MKMDLNVLLSRVDRACDRLARRVGSRLEARLARRSSSVNDLEDLVVAGIRDAMVASHILALPPSYACDEISKALSKLPKHDREALRELYGSIARSATSQAMSRVREKMLRDVAAAVKGTPRDIRKVLRSVGIGQFAGNLVKTIARTQTSLAYNASVWQRSEQDDELWGYEYVTAGDERVRESHAALDGIRYPRDHEFWRQYAPPNGWNCRCSLRPLYARARTRPYDGTPEVDPAFRFNPGRIFAV